MKLAINVRGGTKQLFTHIHVKWDCPKCKSENSDWLVEEEDLNYSQDNYVTCYKCNTKVVLRSKDIYK